LRFVGRAEGRKIAEINAPVACHVAGQMGLSLSKGRHIRVHIGHHDLKIRDGERAAAEIKIARGDRGPIVIRDERHH
jgi:hypothetical protein